jgi:hypothetical protein
MDQLNELVANRKNLKKVSNWRALSALQIRYAQDVATALLYLNALLNSFIYPLLHHSFRKGLCRSVLRPSSKSRIAVFLGKGSRRATRLDQAAATILGNETRGHTEQTLFIC